MLCPSSTIELGRLGTDKSESDRSEIHRSFSLNSSFIVARFVVLCRSVCRPLSPALSSLSLNSSFIVARFVALCRSVCRRWCRHRIALFGPWDQRPIGRCSLDNPAADNDSDNDSDKYGDKEATIAPMANDKLSTKSVESETDRSLER